MEVSQFTGITVKKEDLQLFYRLVYYILVIQWGTKRKTNWLDRKEQTSLMSVEEMRMYTHINPNSCLKLL